MLIYKNYKTWVYIFKKLQVMEFNKLSLGYNVTSQECEETEEGSSIDRNYQQQGWVGEAKVTKSDDSLSTPKNVPE